MSNELIKKIEDLLSETKAIAESSGQIFDSISKEHAGRVVFLSSKARWPCSGFLKVMEKHVAEKLDINPEDVELFMNADSFQFLAKAKDVCVFLTEKDFPFGKLLAARIIADRLADMAFVAERRKEQ